MFSCLLFYPKVTLKFQTNNPPQCVRVCLTLHLPMYKRFCALITVCSITCALRFPSRLQQRHHLSPYSRRCHIEQRTDFVSIFREIIKVLDVTLWLMTLDSSIIIHHLNSGGYSFKDPQGQAANALSLGKSPQVSFRLESQRSQSVRSLPEILRAGPWAASRCID